MEHLVLVVEGVLQELVEALVLLVVAAQVAAVVLVAVVVLAMGPCPAGRGTEGRAPGPPANSPTSATCFCPVSLSARRIIWRRTINFFSVICLVSLASYFNKYYEALTTAVFFAFGLWMVASELV